MKADLDEGRYVSTISLVDDILRIHRRQSVRHCHLHPRIFTCVSCVLASSRVMIILGEIAWLYSIFILTNFSTKVTFSLAILTFFFMAFRIRFLAMEVDMFRRLFL